MESYYIRVNLLREYIDGGLIVVEFYCNYS